MTGCSKIAAMILSSPPQFGQCSIGRTFTDSPNGPPNQSTPKRPHASTRKWPARDIGTAARQPSFIRAAPDSRWLTTRHRSFVRCPQGVASLGIGYAATLAGKASRVERAEQQTTVLIACIDGGGQLS
jgi:hypothetical protein